MSLLSSSPGLVRPEPSVPLSVPPRRGHRSGARPFLRHSGTARTACTTSVQALRAWMPQPRRISDMAGTSTP